MTDTTPWIEFVVPCIPIAQPRQRQRVVATGGRTFAQNYTPTKHPVNAFKAATQMAWRIEQRDHEPLSGPVEMHIAFYLPRPQAKVWKTKPMPECPHAGKPDVDNLIKAVTDALNGIAWRDDSQIARLTATKLVCSGTGAPRVAIAIRQWQPATHKEDHP
jgi:Holliday junction resolvase RusA-like endonuclease